MTGILTAVLVAVGGSVGATARYLLGQILPGRRSTVVVNVLGSFLLGAVAAAVATDTLSGPPGPTARSVSALVGVGFCGAFTTYSSFAVETQSLLADGKVRTVVVFALGTLTAALFGAVVGGWLLG